MRVRSGFALIASLVILVALVGLGAGALFLAQMNLRIAENTRTAAIARANAESGLDSAFVVLAGAVKADGAVPADAAAFRTTFPGFENAAYALAPSDPYTVFGDGSVRVRVIGYGPRNARYEAEALVEPVVDATPPTNGPSVFGDGFVAKDDITMNGNGTFDINFYSGGNIDLHAGSLEAGRVASAAGDTCRFKNGTGTCLTGQDPPEVPTPVFADLRSGLIAQVGLDDALTGCPLVSGTYAGTGAGTPEHPTVVCVAAGASVALVGTLTNLVVIGTDTSTVTILGQTGNSSDDTVHGVKVAAGTIDFQAAMYGYNTFYAHNDIAFGKDVVSHDDTARTFIVTDGDFTLDGAGTSNIYASFWVGGTFRVNGTGDKFRSTVVATNAIVKNGGGSFATLRPPDAIDIPDLPPDTEPDNASAGVRVLSRR